MRSNPRETAIRVWARLTRAQQIALVAIERALKSAKLPPLAWYDALLELERAGEKGLRPYELEREMLLAQYNLSRLIDRIECAGYVERRPCDDDGRRQVVVITAAGREIRKRMWAVYQPAIQRAVGDHLSAPQVRTLDALLGKLIANANDAKAAKGVRARNQTHTHPRRRVRKLILPAIRFPLPRFLAATLPIS
jgi:DNA-binding MarR family transcriptional regulator